MLVVGLFPAVVVAVAFLTGLASGKILETACPTWMYRNNISSADPGTLSAECKCGDNLRDVIQCNIDSQQVKVLVCYGITYSELHNTTVVGSLLLKCALKRDYIFYYSVSNNVSQLDVDVCYPYNRKGQMCGSCLEGYATAVYSFNSGCCICNSTDVLSNVLKFVAVALLPVTICYIAILFFKFRATDPILGEYILHCQLVSTSVLQRFSDIDLQMDDLKTSRIFKLFMFTINGVWNLDFGRMLYRPFCLHPRLSMHQVVALDYLIAFYPLLLLLLTYILVKLHDNYRLMVIIWKPFFFCMKLIQKKWSIKASLVDVFATFLILSNVKLLNVSFDLISAPVTLWTVTGQSLPTKYTYLNGSMEYLGKQHLPYFVLGVVAILVFNVLPIFLFCLYPFRCFQRCLNRCSLSSPSLHIFMDAFQGCYRTTPRDYRSIAALPFLVRLLSFVIFYLTLNRFFCSLMSLFLILNACVVGIFLPFRLKRQNVASILMFLNLSCYYFLLNTFKLSVYPSSLNWYILERLVPLMAIMPLVVVLSYCLFKSCCKRMIGGCISHCNTKKRDGYQVLEPQLRDFSEEVNENTSLQFS